MSNGTGGLDKKHCIHLENGCFSSKTNTQASDIEQLLAAFDESASPSGLVIHFHGGLVSYAGGKTIAENLTPVYAAAGAYPVFFVWEAGPFEAIFNNLGDIAKEGIFRELVRKVIEFSLGRLGGVVGAKGIVAPAVDPQEVARLTDAWFAGKSEIVPYADRVLLKGKDQTRAARLADTAFEMELQANLEMDARFRTAVQEVSNGLLPLGSLQSTRGVGARGASTTLMDPKALDEVVEPPASGQKGIISMAKMAVAVAKVVYRVVKRYLAGRDHGLYGTVEEEVLRAFYIDKLGKVLLWNQMKKDTADAFSTNIAQGREPGGTMFLKALAGHLAKRGNAGNPPPRITLIGHSTGAVYICNFLAAASQWLPAGFKFDIILLAPAISFERFHACISANTKWVGGIRLFGMKDEVELQNAMAQGALGAIARWVYPYSLLYFVSGLLEDENKDIPDHPILGMQRFFDQKDVFNATDYPEVEWARKFFATPPQHCAVWSVTNGGEGLASESRQHGDFDNDKATLASVQWLLKNGFGR